MFGKFRVLAIAPTHAAGHPDDAISYHREPVSVGSGFEHSDGSIAVYLDALPISGRLLLVPEGDARAKPVRRGPL